MTDLGARAFSLQLATDVQTSAKSLVEVMEAAGFPGMKSRSCLPSSICAGDMPVSGSGVLRSWSRPFTSVTVSSSPDIFTASLITRLAAPTDLSAFWLAWGNPTEDFL